MTRPILLVCGFGRCGSSAIMQMCYHGGLRVAGKWPDFEPHDPFALTPQGKARPLSPLDDWVLECEAIKLLEPANNPIREGRYRVIWLDRDIREQAKSWGKFRRVHLRDKADRRKAVGAMRLHMKRNRERQLRVANRLSECPPLMMRFEEILDNPLGCAQEIADFIERPDMNVRRMAAGVLKRGPECQKEFIEARLKNMRLVAGVS